MEGFENGDQSRKKMLDNSRGAAQGKANKMR
jgi:hypothetical protein